MNLPEVRYSEPITSTGIEDMMADAANLYVSVQNCDAARLMNPDIPKASDGSVLSLTLSMMLYHMIGQMVRVSPNPITITNPGYTMENAKRIILQLSEAYYNSTHGKLIKVQRDLYRVIPLIANLLYGEFTMGEINSSYRAVIEYLVDSDKANPIMSRLGQLVS